jgi:hypothetical protein
MAKLVAPAFYGNSLGSNPDISQKYKMGDIIKGVANTLMPAKKCIQTKCPWDDCSSRQTVKLFKLGPKHKDDFA